jgi:hypothetical protein
MRTLCIALLLSTLLFTTGCPTVDFGNPDDIRVKADGALRPYFPNVHTYVEGDVIAGLTCVYGAGPELIQQIADTLPTLTTMNDLRRLRRYGGLIGNHTYSTFGIGFEHALVAYDVDSGQVRYEPINTPEWNAKYQSECGGVADHYERGSNNTSSGGGRSHQIAFIGSWNVSFVKDGKVRITTWYDTLGAYNSQQAFEQHRAEEIASREALIHKQMADRNATNVTLSFMTVTAMPVDDRYLAH